MMADGAEEKKIFVGGLSWETNEEKLRNYFQEFGHVVECLVMKNPETGKSRGFGFVTFVDSNSVRKVLNVQNHQLDGRTIDPKECNPRSSTLKLRNTNHNNQNRQQHQQQQQQQDYCSKIFLGGLPPNITEANLKEFFSKYGKVNEAIIMFDQEKKKSRGFGFLSFDNEESINKVVAEHFVNINGKQVEVKRAEPQPNKSITPAPSLSSATPTAAATTPTMNGNVHHLQQQQHPMSIGNNGSMNLAALTAAVNSGSNNAVPPNLALPYFMPTWPMWPTPVPSPVAAINGMSNLSGFTPAATNTVWNPSTAAAAAAAIAATAAAGPPNWTPYPAAYPTGWPGSAPSITPFVPPPPTTPQHHQHPMTPTPFGHVPMTPTGVVHHTHLPSSNFLPPAVVQPPTQTEHTMSSMNVNFHHPMAANGSLVGANSSVSNAIISPINPQQTRNHQHDTNNYNGNMSSTPQHQAIGPNLMFRPSGNIAGTSFPHFISSAAANNAVIMNSSSNNNNTGNNTQSINHLQQQQQQQHANQVALINNLSSISPDYLISDGNNTNGGIGGLSITSSLPVSQQQPPTQQTISGDNNNTNGFNQSQHPQPQTFHGSRMINIQTQNQGYHPYRRS